MMSCGNRSHFLRRRSEDRDILVEQELRSDLALVSMDRNQMKQAFYNVIKNSFQAMKSEGILHIKTDREDHFVSVSFADTGGRHLAGEHEAGFSSPISRRYQPDRGSGC